MVEFKEPFCNLSTRYKQDVFFNGHDAFVPPRSINLGLRFETKCGITKTVYDTFQYVSVKDTLLVLLKSEEYVRGLLKTQMTPSSSEVISHSTHGELLKNRLALSNPANLTIFLQLFYDGMGTTNPLRGQGTMSSVGVFYYVVKNLPDSWNTCFSNVHLLALCYSHNLKVHGFSPILDNFCQELNELSTNGFHGVFPVIGNATVCVELLQVASDNLALNSMLGFIESFSGDYFCTLCYATRDSIQVGFVEECFQTRSRCEYDKDVVNAYTLRLC